MSSYVSTISFTCTLCSQGISPITILPNSLAKSLAWFPVTPNNAGISAILLASRLIPELSATVSWYEMRPAHLEFVYQHPYMGLPADEEVWCFASKVWTWVDVTWNAQTCEELGLYHKKSNFTRLCVQSTPRECFFIFTFINYIPWIKVNNWLLLQVEADNV